MTLLLLKTGKTWTPVRKCQCISLRRCRRVHWKNGRRFYGCATNTKVSTSWPTKNRKLKLNLSGFLLQSTIVDQYLLAMVLIYLERARLTSIGYTKDRYFFYALFLAMGKNCHAMIFPRSHNSTYRNGGGRCRWTFGSYLLCGWATAPAIHYPRNAERRRNEVE